MGGLSHDAYLIQVGVCRGLETALGLPGHLEAQARVIDERNATRATRPPDASSYTSSLPFFGGSWFEHWDRIRNATTGSGRSPR